MRQTLAPPDVWSGKTDRIGRWVKDNDRFVVAGTWLECHTQLAQVQEIMGHSTVCLTSVRLTSRMQRIICCGPSLRSTGEPSPWTTGQAIV